MSGLTGLGCGCSLQKAPRGATVGAALSTRYPPIIHRFSTVRPAPIHGLFQLARCCGIQSEMVPSGVHSAENIQALGDRWRKMDPRIPSNVEVLGMSEKPIVCEADQVAAHAYLFGDLDAPRS